MWCFLQFIFCPYHACFVYIPKLSLDEEEINKSIIVWVWTILKIDKNVKGFLVILHDEDKKFSAFDKKKKNIKIISLYYFVSL